VTLRTGERSPFALTESDSESLRARLDLALQRARRSGRATLATITCALPSDIDPSAVACASRREGEPWFVFEQPDRGGYALAGLGQVICLEGSGEDRFASVADRWRSLSAAAVADSPGDPDGGGPIAVGGLIYVVTEQADLVEDARRAHDAEVLPAYYEALGPIDIQDSRR